MKSITSKVWTIKVCCLSKPIRDFSGKEILESFFLHVPWVFYLAFVAVRSADTYNLIYNNALGGKAFHLFWVKAPLSQGRPAPLCSKTAWLISHKNE